MSTQTFLPLAEDASLIEQEWCTLCVREPGDEPGMPQDVVTTRTLPTDVGPQLFSELTCGHRVISEMPLDTDLRFDYQGEYAA